MMTIKTGQETYVIYHIDSNANKYKKNNFIFLLLLLLLSIIISF